MALFGWKKSDSGAGQSPPDKGGDAASDDGFEPQPEKARKWFEHAKTYADTTNFAGALFSYANGIKLDPEAMSAHEAMYEVAIQYMNTGGKPASGSEIRKLEDSQPVSKFAAAEFAWMKDVANPSLALKALAAAVKAGQKEYGHWIASKVLGTLLRSKKQSKSMLITAKDLFKEVNAWNEALAAGQHALRLDPTDGALDHELKDISAQRAMDQGGYERAAGKEGGFREFIRSAEKQREMQEAESIVAGQSVEERNLQRAREAYEKTPKVPEVLNLYAQLVKKQGTPEAEQLAHEIYLKGYEDTGEYRFRMYAGDIQIDQLRREYESLQAAIEASPNDAAAAQQAQAVKERLLDLEAEEFAERAAKYPTDRFLKARLGEIEFARGKYDDAMALLQAAKDEPKLRVRAGHVLGRCFAAEGWHREAISEFKEALNSVDPTERDRELAIRYDLMISLIEHARQEREVNSAREALDICSLIARKDITYRDIRAKRKEVDQVIRDLAESKA